jgi:hypothetical protein
LVAGVGLRVADRDQFEFFTARVGDGGEQVVDHDGFGLVDAPVVQRGPQKFPVTQPDGGVHPVVGAARGDRQHGGQLFGGAVERVAHRLDPGVQFGGQYRGVRLVAAQGHFGVVDGVAQVLVVEPACVGQRGAD